MKLFTKNIKSKTVILSESQLVSLKEATDGKFSADVLDSIPDFKNRKNYCIQHLGEPIGKGSSRLVFQIDDEKVLKLAINDAGIAQNLEEATWDKQVYNFIPKIYSTSNNNWWILCEFVLPAETRDFPYCIGIDWYTFTDFVETVASQYDGNASHCHMSSFQLDDLIDEHEILSDLFDYMCNRHIPEGDITTIENWGLAKRNGDAYLVLLDHGFTFEIYYKYYANESKRRFTGKRINEATDGSFSLDELSKIKDFKQKVLYCQKHLGDYIGSGSSRVVFQIDDEKVLKLAFNEAGVEQNIEECKWADGRYSIFPKIFDFDKNGSWIISEFVLPAEQKDFDYFLNKYNKAPWIRKWSEFVEFIWSLDAIQKGYDWRVYNDEKIEELRKNPLFGEIYDYVMTNNIPIGDLTVIGNWGLAKRNGDAMPVVLDAGWRNGLNDQFYKGNDYIMDIKDLLYEP